MKKILGVLLTTLLITGLASPVYADETEVDCAAEPNNSACIVTTDDEIPTGDQAPIYEETEAGETIPQPTDYPEEGEPLIITPVEDDTDSDSETPAEKDMWPIYVSVGAISAVIVVFVILNLLGRKKKS